MKFLEAQSAEKALEIIKIHTPDIILMDLRFPDLSGYEAAALIRAASKDKNSVIIAFTATSMREEPDEARSLFDDVLQKPVSKNELYALLKRYIIFKKVHKIEEEEGEDRLIEIIKLPDERYNQLLRDIDEELLPYWNDIKDSLVIFEIEEFVNKLKETQEKYSVSFLDGYIKEISKHLKNIDIENIQTKLKEFKTIVEKIKHRD